jgi:hypothetical protein
MNGFHDHLLIERAKDAEMGAAAKRSFLGARKSMVSLFQESLRSWWNLMQDPYMRKEWFSEKEAGHRIHSKLPTDDKWVPFSQFEADRLSNILFVRFRDALVGVDRYSKVEVSSQGEMEVSLRIDADSKSKAFVLPSKSLMGIDYAQAQNKMGWTIIALDLKSSITKDGRVVARGTFAEPSGARTARITIGGLEKAVKRNDFGSLLLRTVDMGRTKAYAEFDKFANRIGSFMDMHVSTYIHEYIHLLDWLRRGMWRNKGETKGVEAIWQGDGNLSPYYKSNLEYNAHFQAAATMAREGVRMFLVSITSDGFAYEKIGAAGESVSIADVPKIISVALEREYARVLTRVSEEAKVRLKEYLSRFGGVKFTPQMLLVMWFMYETTAAVSYWSSDEAMRRKFLTRLYSVQNDIDGIVREYLARVRSGKYPSKQEWRKSIDAVRKMEYNILYSGFLMKSVSRDVFDPRNLHAA